MDKKMTGPQRKTRHRSAQNIKFLQKNEGAVAGTWKSWRDRVRPIQAPTAAASKKHKRPSSAAAKLESVPEPFDLGRMTSDFSREIQVCVNGKLSESPESAELTRTFARRKRTGSMQSGGSEEDALLEEMLGLERLLLAGLDDGSQGRQKVPLCWDDLPVSSIRPSSPGGSSDGHPKNKARDQKKVTEEDGDSMKQLPPNESPAPTASCHKESSLDLEVMVTWGDQCLLPWQQHYTQTHSEDTSMQHVANPEVRVPSPSPHLEVSGKFAGSPEHSSGHQLVENVLNRSKGAGRLIGVTKRDYLDDLLCLWLRQPHRGEKVSSVKLESCTFNVYLSETANNGKGSTRVFKEVSLRKVVHNLYVFKFHLVASLPWITDVCQLSRRTLGVSLFISRPERFEGLVVADRITLTPSPHTPSSTSPPAANQTSPRHTQHQPQTNNAEQDEDKITLAVDSAVLDTTSQQAQEFILSFYHNPYQVSTHAQEKAQRVKQGQRLRNSQTNKETKPYTKLVQKHLGKFLDKSAGSTGRGTESGGQAHILVCSNSLHTKQKKASRRHRSSPHVVLPSSQGGGGDSVRGALSCQRLGFLHQHNVGQKQDTIEEETSVSWKSAVAVETTDSLTS